VPEPDSNAPSEREPISESDAESEHDVDGEGARERALAQHCAAEFLKKSSCGRMNDFQKSSEHF
jgi:hypothetical protein